MLLVRDPQKKVKSKFIIIIKPFYYLMLTKKKKKTNKQNKGGLVILLQAEKPDIPTLLCNKQRLNLINVHKISYAIFKHYKLLLKKVTTLSNLDFS